jgi:NhaP-type Na+/H+ or K+/H+ antiporter
MMKKGRFMVKHSSISTAFTVYSGYIAFTFCEVFEFSGVAAVLICGALMQHYLTYNLSKAASKSSRVTVKACAYVCESFIYIYLGFGVF